MTVSNLQRTCYHEAGHAVVGYLLGLKIKEVFINEDSDSGVEFIDRPTGEHEYDYGRYLTPEQRKVEGRLDIMASWAGYFAEKYFFGEIDVPGLQHDYTSIRITSRCIIPTLIEASSYAEEIKFETEIFMNKPEIWESIRKVGEILIVKRSLGFDEVKMLIDSIVVNQ